MSYDNNIAVTINRDKIYIQKQEEFLARKLNQQIYYLHKQQLSW